MRYSGLGLVGIWVKGVLLLFVVARLSFRFEIICYFYQLCMAVRSL